MGSEGTRREEYLRIVFSRKGWDAAAGGGPSPMIGGQPWSMPIPGGSSGSGRTYGDLTEPRPALAKDLQGWDASMPCHLDPDLEGGAVPEERPEGWRGALGQVGAAARHLRNEEVGAGDLMLFFGLFRETAQDQNGEWRYEGPPLQAIWGWLEIERVEEAGRSLLDAEPWLARHPHMGPGWGAPNDLYIAREESRLGLERGYGVCARAHRVTAEGQTPSVWRRPPWLARSGMSYHGDPKRWREPGLVRTVGRGQEFVAKMGPGDRDEALGWCREALGMEACR